MPTGHAYRMGVQVFMVLALEGYSNKKYLQVGRPTRPTLSASPIYFARAVWFGLAHTVLSAIL
jgi:hypothetical protein